MSGAAVARLVATCFGLGHLRPAPGTIGSAFGLALFWLLLRDQAVLVQLVAVVVVSAVGIAAATLVSRQMQEDDPSEVVVDEVAGMWLSLLGATGAAEVVLAFFLFRALDIVKPFPASRLESLPGGWGIMLDDLAAGAYTLAALKLLLWMGWLS